MQCPVFASGLKTKTALSFLPVCHSINIYLIGQESDLKSSESLQNHWARVGTELSSCDLDTSFSGQTLAEAFPCKAQWKMNKKVLVRTDKERRGGTEAPIEIS